MTRLEKKVALVTGAAQGIGYAISKTLVENGAFVFLTDIQDKKGKQVAQKIGQSCEYIHLDVREERCWKEAMSKIKKLKSRLDIVVNNAGITGFEDGNFMHDPENVSIEEWRRVHRTNMDGTFLGCKYAIATMRETCSSGAIINMSSRSGLVGIPGAAAYASSKAAIRNHTKTVAIYCAEQNLNIRCNSIHPAAILTPMWEAMIGDGPDRQERINEIVSDCPMKRFGQATEVAEVVLLLASDNAAYINGAEINIDGGILAGSVAPPQN